MNPFRGSNHYINNVEQLIGRSKELDNVRTHIAEQRDMLLIGLKGIGKTSLLHCAVDTAFRREMIETKKILVTRPFEYPVTLATEKVYPLLMDQVIKTFALLDAETAEKLTSIIKGYRDQLSSPAEQFKSSITAFHDLYGFSVTLVIDNFEHFANSTSVTAEQHSELRGLMDETALRFIMVTNYDLTRDALPPHSQYSYLLQKFSGDPFSVEQFTMAKVKSMLAREPWPDQVDDKTLRSLAGKIYELSGGIPLMARHVAAEVYDRLQEKDFALWTGEDWDVVSNKTYQNNQSLLNSWCGMLCSTWVDALKQVHTRSGVPENTGIAMNLFWRRLLKMSPFGGGSYSYVSPLLERFVAEGNVKPDNSLLPAGTLAIAQVDMNRLMSMVQLLVDRSKAQAIDDNKPLSAQIVEAPVNSDQQVTLDIAFNNYRAEHPNDLPDSLLADLSDFCLQELKQALLFKAYLDQGSDGLGNPTRAALIHYGVVMERRLCDCFYDLLTIHPQLLTDGLNRDNAHIGAFISALRSREYSLAGFCAQIGHPEYDRQWWRDVTSGLFSANNLRIDSAHAKQARDVEEMNDLLLGSQSLLAKLAIGKALFNELCGGERVPDQADQFALRNKTLAFRCTRAKPNGGLGGVLLPSSYGASISKSKVNAAQQGTLLPADLNQAVGHEFNVCVEGYDQQGHVFTVRVVSGFHN